MNMIDEKRQGDTDPRMSHEPKESSINCHSDPSSHQEHESSCTLLHGDVLIRVFSFLPWKEAVVCCRQVSKQWNEAVSNSSLPDQELHFRDASVMVNHISEISTCLPKLHNLHIEQQDASMNNDDDDDDHDHRPIRDDDIRQICQSLIHLRSFTCRHAIELRHSFSEISKLQHLQKLNLSGNVHLEMNLKDLAASSYANNLAEVRCVNNRSMTGDLKDVGTSMNQLVILDVSGCVDITGNLLDLRQFAHLEWFGISRTKVQGDLRDVKETDYPALQCIGLDHETIYGASEFNRVSHAHAIMKGRHNLVMKQSSQDCPIWPFLLGLSTTSPDYHERLEQRLYSSERDPPFRIENVLVGKRRGWRWSNHLGGVCPVQWLDLEPPIKDEDYRKEFSDLKEEEALSFFGEFLDPPTPLEYERLCRERC